MCVKVLVRWHVECWFLHLSTHSINNRCCHKYLEGYNATPKTNCQNIFFLSHSRIDRDVFWEYWSISWFIEAKKQDLYLNVLATSLTNVTIMSLIGTHLAYRWCIFISIKLVWITLRGLRAIFYFLVIVNKIIISITITKDHVK